MFIFRTLFCDVSHSCFMGAFLIFLDDIFACLAGAAFLLRDGRVRKPDDRRAVPSERGLLDIHRHGQRHSRVQQHHPTVWRCLHQRHKPSGGNLEGSPTDDPRSIRLLDHGSCAGLIYRILLQYRMTPIYRMYT